MLKMRNAAVFCLLALAACTWETGGESADRPAPVVPTTPTQAAAKRSDKPEAVDTGEPKRDPSVRFDASKRFWRIDWDRSRSISEQVEEKAEAVSKISRERPGELAGSRMYLSLDYLSYPEFVERLARHASADPVWIAEGRDRKERGEPRIRALHEYTVGVSNGERLFSELDAIFAGSGLVPTLKSVEKCSTARPGAKGGMGEWLKGRGLGPKAPLPMGCLMGTFEISTFPARRDRP